jgi:hypothetical protein
MNKVELIKSLDQATDRAVTYVIQSSYPIPLSKNSMLVGNLFVQKNSNGFYDVYSFNKTPIFENIVNFEIAIILAQQHSMGEKSIVRKILYLEEKYSKYHNDMIHYLNCMKTAKRKNDDERLLILEDKFQTTELLARSIKEKISSYKRTK